MAADSTLLALKRTLLADQRSQGHVVVPIDGEPDDGGAVAAGGEHEAAVRREADGGDFLLVAGEREDFLAGSRSVRASQSLTVLSWLPVSTRVPSGEKATEVTAAVWPASSTSCLPVAASQMMAVVSWLPVMTSRPSGEKRPQSTAQSWPASVC